MGDEFFQSFAFHSFLGELGTGFGLSLALHESFRLCKEVGQENVMVGSHWIESFHGSEEIAGDQFSALVDQLVEGVLAVGTRLSPNNRTSTPSDGFAVTIHSLAVAFHVALLEVGGEAVEILIVRQDGVSLGVVEVVVPDS